MNVHGARITVVIEADGKRQELTAFAHAVEAKLDPDYHDYYPTLSFDTRLDWVDWDFRMTAHSLRNLEIKRDPHWVWLESESRKAEQMLTGQEP